MQAVALIDGMTGNTESQNRRAQLPHPSDTPTFSDLLNRIDSAPFRNPLERQPTSYNPETGTPGPRRGSREETSSYALYRDAGSQADREALAGSEAPGTVRSQDEAAGSKSDGSGASAKGSAASGGQEHGSRESAPEGQEPRERIAREREEASLRRAEEAQSKSASQRAQQSSGKGEERAASGKGAATEKEGDALQELSGKGKLSPATKQGGDATEADTAEQGAILAGENRSRNVGTAAAGASKAEARASTALTAAGRAAEAGGVAVKIGRGAEAPKEDEKGGGDRRGGKQVTDAGAEREGAERRNPGNVAAAGGSLRAEADTKAAREAATMVAREQRNDGESRRRAPAEAEGRDHAERKLRIVDLRAPREGGDSRNPGGEQNGRTGLKESADSRQFEASQGSTVRFEGEESGFARQLGSNPAGRGESMAERLGQQQQQLHRFLRESGYSEIVRNARVMLREGGNGELRLNLSPKELGSVRVQLQLQDSHIAGRIIVENSTVREVFEQNLDQLQRAFQSQGLETGKLEVTVEQRGDGQQRRGRGEPGPGDGARVFEEHTARLPDSFYEDAQVNLMA